MTQQPELFEKSETSACNVIDARARFEDRVLSWVQQMVQSNQMPPQKEGKVIWLGRRAA